MKGKNGERGTNIREVVSEGIGDKDLVAQPVCFNNNTIVEIMRENTGHLKNHKLSIRQLVYFVRVRVTNAYG